MADTLEDLRSHLFDTIKALKSPDQPMELDRAKVVADVARTIIETAKVEVSFLEATGSINGSGFIAAPTQRQLPTAKPTGGLEPLRPARRA